jgi:hypothetical protein
MHLAWTDVNLQKENTSTINMEQMLYGHLFMSWLRSKHGEI